MTSAEAVALIGAAVAGAHPAIWADCGAGGGTFTEALASLLGETDEVVAIDHNARALRELRNLPRRSRGARIRVVEGDVRCLDAIPNIAERPLDGVLFSNVLHFFPDPESVLEHARRCLKPRAPIVVVEYDRRNASRWVPHPLPPLTLAEAAAHAGLTEIAEVGRQRSRYQGELYCATLLAPPQRIINRRDHDAQA